MKKIIIFIWFDGFLIILDMLGGGIKLDLFYIVLIVIID